MNILITNKNAKITGGLIIFSMVTGLLSVSPSVDSLDYMTQSAAHSNQVIFAALSQFILALIYLVIALLFFPILTKVNQSFAVSFLSFRIIASVLMIVGTALLLSVLLLSQGYHASPDSNLSTLGIVGNMLKNTRDYVNHVFMVIALGISNLILYYLFFKSKLIPQWMSAWGFIGAILSIVASIMLLFQVIEVITMEYLILNLPTALMELILGFWLLTKTSPSRGGQGGGTLRESLSR